MQLVTAYKTSDGDLFLSEDDAKKHENELNFQAWWQENGRPFDRYDWVDAREFFFENWLELKKFFEENHKPAPIDYSSPSSALRR
jgi:hypothetical protein